MKILQNCLLPHAFACFLTLLLLQLPVQADDIKLTEGTPEEVGMSAAVVKAGATLFEEAVEKDELRGVVLLVARRGKIVLHQAIGWSNKEEKVPMRKDSLFRMASNTKPVTTTALLMLKDQGKLSMDDNVCKHLPAWDNHRAGFIKLKHLASHTSGLRISPTFIKPLWEKSEEYPDAPCLRAEADRFGKIGAVEVPGTTFQYNNAGFNTLGAVIEQVAGQPVKDFFREKIYAPLKMSNTWNYEADAPHDRMCRVYSRKGSKWTIQWSPGDEPDWPFVRTSGGMITTAADYAIFLQMILNEGVYDGHRILRPESVTAATSIQTESAYSASDFAARQKFYGYGWFVDRAGIKSHGGSDGTYAWIDPERQILGIVLTQSPGGRNPREQFRQVITAACYAGK